MKVTAAIASSMAIAVAHSGSATQYTTVAPRATQYTSVPRATQYATVPRTAVRGPAPVRVVQHVSGEQVMGLNGRALPASNGLGFNFAEVLEYDLANRLDDEIEGEWGVVAGEYLSGGFEEKDIYLVSILTDKDETDYSKLNDALDYGYASNGFGQGIRFETSNVNSQELLIETLEGNMEEYLFDKILDEETTDDLWQDVEEDFQEELIWSGFQGDSFMKWLLIEKYYDSGESKVTNDFLEIALLGGMGDVNPMMFKYLLDDDDDSASGDEDDDSFLEMMMFAGGNMGSMSNNPGLMMLLLDDDDDSGSADDDDSLMKMLAFGGLGGGENAVNPMLLAMIMDDEDKDSGDDDDSMLQYLMLSGGAGF